MRFDLRTGEQRTLRLRGRGSAGYTWTWDVDGEQGNVDLALGPAEAPPRAAPGGLPPSSSSIDEILTITGRAPGQVRVHLALRRPWERDIPPLEEMTLDVRVT